MRSSRFRLLVACLILLALVGCSSAPDQPQAVVDAKNEAARFSEFGNGHFNRGEFELALQFFELALQRNLSVDHLAGVAGSYNSIGRVYAATGRLDQARGAYVLAEEAAERSGEEAAVVLTYINVGELELREGNDEEALILLERAESMIGEDEPAAADAAILYHNLGTLYARRGEIERAREQLERARSINEANGAWAELGSNLFMLASIASREGEFETAYILASQALDSDKRAENSTGIAADLWALGQIRERQAEPDQAYQYYLRSLRVALTIDDIPRILSTLDALARLAVEIGRTAEGEEFAAQALRIREAVE